jgi:chromosomal replication initiator protein
MSQREPKMVWAEVLKELSQSMSSSSFSTWVKPLTLRSLDLVGETHAIARITAESPYVAQQAELRCYAQIKNIVDRTTGLSCDLSFEEITTTQPQHSNPLDVEPTSTQPQQGSSPLFTPGSDNRPKQPLTHLRSQSPGASQSSEPLSLFSPSAIRMPTVDRYKLAAQKAHLREDFTFDSIAVSGSNEMAYAAASAVAQSPGAVYNPLFLWGGVGVGKTHLMQSIGNVILKQSPETPIIYCMGEEFLNEIIGAIRNKKTLEFKERYRQLKVLLIDDIQFIAGKDTAQEEFFHTFNAITRAGGQVIMTSDRPPHEIHPLEDRLRSRFEGGLTIDIQQPTFELRTAILLIKAQKLALELPMNLAQIIASEVESTRKLEGVIFKLHSAHRFQNKPLDENLVRMVLGQESKPVISRQNVKPSAILRAVTSHFHISTNTIRGESRKREYVLARHIAMFLMKSELNVPYAEIGHTFGGRDHSSVMHAVSRIEKDMKENSTINQHVSAIRVSLSSL